MQRNTARGLVAPNLNKLEAAWYANLQTLVHAGELRAVWAQSLSWKIGDDCRYTPDFIRQEKDGELVADEVKGFMRDDAMVKLKVFARVSPFRIFLVTRKRGVWSRVEVQP